MSKTQELKSENVVPAPQGMRQALNMSAAFLLNVPYEDREAFARSAGAAGQKCGAAFGVITHGIAHPNAKDPTKDSVRWVGDIGFQMRDGTLGRTSNTYLPGSVERPLYNAGIPVVREGSGQAPPPFRAEFSVDFWIEPCAKSRAATGYLYACYDRIERHRFAINHLAPPEIRALLPAEHAEPEAQLLGYDPETGEVDEEDKTFGQPHHGHKAEGQEAAE